MSEATIALAVKRIHKLNGNGPLAAFVDLNVNDDLLIKGLRVINGAKGTFVSMPQEKGRDDKWYDTVVCLSDDIRAEISKCVLEAYQKEQSSSFDE